MGRDDRAHDLIIDLQVFPELLFQGADESVARLGAVRLQDFTR